MISASAIAKNRPSAGRPKKKPSKKERSGQSASEGKPRSRGAGPQEKNIKPASPLEPLPERGRGAL